MKCVMLFLNALSQVINLDGLQMEDSNTEKKEWDHKEGGGTANSGGGGFSALDAEMGVEKGREGGGLIEEVSTSTRTCS